MGYLIHFLLKDMTVWSWSKSPFFPNNCRPSPTARATIGRSNNGPYWSAVGGIRDPWILDPNGRTPLTDHRPTYGSWVVSPVLTPCMPVNKLKFLISLDPRCYNKSRGCLSVWFRILREMKSIIHIFHSLKPDAWRAIRICISSASTKCKMTFPVGYVAISKHWNYIYDRFNFLSWMAMFCKSVL